MVAGFQLVNVAYSKTHFSARIAPPEAVLVDAAQRAELVLRWWPGLARAGQQPERPAGALADDFGRGARMPGRQLQLAIDAGGAQHREVGDHGGRTAAREPGRPSARAPLEEARRRHIADARHQPPALMVHDCDQAA